MRERKKLIFVLAGIGILLAGTLYGLTREGEKIVQSNSDGGMVAMVVPPLDMAAPVNTEVATFALG